jgi:uridine kinase
MHYFSIKEMNDASVNAAAFIAKCDAEYDAMIQAAAETILAAGEEKPLVLLSGGSGCGKTTTAHRIEQYLDTHGHETHVLSMDNYYYRPTDFEYPVDEEGKIDLESPLLLDAELLSDHLQKIIRCEPIEMPTFDFVNECRSDVTIPFHRKPGERVIMEGIHALNPEVVGAAHGMSTKIYISVRTRVQDSAGMCCIPPASGSCAACCATSAIAGKVFPIPSTVCAVSIGASVCTSCPTSTTPTSSWTPLSPMSWQYTAMTFWPAWPK